MDVLRKMIDGEHALRVWLWISLACNMIIIVTGAVVRLTASGLGCPTWPQCTAESYVPSPEAGLHGIIEFGNRLMTFVLAAAALGAFVSATRNRGREHHLWGLTLSVGLGIPAQGVIGGVTVWSGLNPYIVALHLLLSVVLIVLCVWALADAYPIVPTSLPRGPRWLVIVTFAATMACIWLGTIVTGAGPHAGDAGAARNGLDIETVARWHSVSAWVVTGLAAACTAWLTRHATGPGLRAAWALLGTVILQGVIGYVQFFTHLPGPLVGLHMFGLTLVTAAAAWLLVATTRQSS